jgi:methionyl aminopeptidase
MIYLKNLDELNKLEKLNKMGAEVLAMCYEHLKPGTVTLELEALALKYCIDNKVLPSFRNYRGFPHSICVSINDEVVHGFPDERKVKDGDIVKVDFGLKKDGFFSDSAFTKIIGTVPKNVERLVKTTKECLYEGVAKALKGNRLYDISRSIESLANDNFFGIVRNYVGHAVGFALHEKPKLPNYVGNGTNWKLVPGMVLAIEPILVENNHEVTLDKNNWTVRTKDGGFAAHWEHSVAITEGGPRILSKL